VGLARPPALTPDQVRAARVSFLQGMCGLALARSLGVSGPTISRALRGVGAYYGSIPGAVPAKAWSGDKTIEEEVRRLHANGHSLTAIGVGFGTSLGRIHRLAGDLRRVNNP
jgi:hypothetical protein